MGYASKGSTASLAGGVGTGFALILAGYLSLQAFHKRKNSYFALILETGITLFISLEKNCISYWPSLDLFCFIVLK